MNWFQSKSLKFEQILIPEGTADETFSKKRNTED